MMSGARLGELRQIYLQTAARLTQQETGAAKS